MPKTRIGSTIDTALESEFRVGDYRNEIKQMIAHMSTFLKKTIKHKRKKSHAKSY